MVLTLSAPPGRRKEFLEKISTYSCTSRKVGLERGGGEGGAGQAFGDWRAPADGAPASCARRSRWCAAAARQLLATPDKPNANWLLEQPLAINDSHADYPALLMANHLLGGEPPRGCGRASASRAG